MRNLEEYKNEVFNKLTEENKLQWLYDMSKQLCEIDNIIKDILNNNQLSKEEILAKINEIKTKLGDDY